MNTEPARPEPDSPNPASEATGRWSVRVRRTPKFANFALLGALAGAITAFVLTVAVPPDPDYARSLGLPEFSQLQVFGFLLLIGLVIGVALALTVAILLDRRNDSRSRTVEADRLDVREAQAIPTDAAGAASAPALEQNPPQTPHTTNEGNA